MERLKDLNCDIAFENQGEMQKFLGEMEKNDIFVPLKTSSIKTFIENNEGFLSGINGDTGRVEKYPLWPFSIKSLEKRSGDNAVGHELMSTEQILNSMNNYWGLHQKKSCVARIRGDKIMGLGSEQYETISQEGLLSATTAWLDANHGSAYAFTAGQYTHQRTKVSFDVTDAIDLAYKKAWKAAGLPERLLDKSKITVTVYTDDVAECSATALLCMDVGGSTFLIGNPITVEHRNGRGGIEAFEKALSKADITIRDELNSLTKLMGVSLLHPKEAAIMALKKAKIDKLSKKACKELIDDMMASAGESAYIVYLYLHGILETSYGSKLKEERKLRVITALRTLVKENWSKFDVSAASL